MWKALKKLLDPETWIADDYPDCDDEKDFGILASDVARKINIFPGFVKPELEKMVSLGNPF